MCDPKPGSDQRLVAALMLSMYGVTAIISRDMCIVPAATIPLPSAGIRFTGLIQARRVGALAVPGCDANSMSCTPLCVRVCEQRLVLVAHAHCDEVSADSCIAAPGWYAL
jgi:hypothetical protein